MDSDRVNAARRSIVPALEGARILLVDVCQALRARGITGHLSPPSAVPVAGAAAPVAP